MQELFIMSLKLFLEAQPWLILPQKLRLLGQAELSRPRSSYACVEVMGMPASLSFFGLAQSRRMIRETSLCSYVEFILSPLCPTACPCSLQDQIAYRQHQTKRGGRHPQC